MAPVISRMPVDQPAYAEPRPTRRTASPDGEAGGWHPARCATWRPCPFPQERMARGLSSMLAARTAGRHAAAGRCARPGLPGAGTPGTMRIWCLAASRRRKRTSVAAGGGSCLGLACARIQHGHRSGGDRPPCIDQGEGHLRLARNFLLRVAALVSSGTLSMRSGTLRLLCPPTVERIRLSAKSSRSFPSHAKRTVASVTAASARTWASLDLRMARSRIRGKAAWASDASMSIASPRWL